MFTQLDAPIPYRSVDAASFRIVNDSMLFGLMVETLPVKMAPSTTLRGAEDPLTEPTPRIRTFVPAPGWPLLPANMTPGDEPSRIWVGLVTARLSNCRALMLIAEPTRSEEHTSELQSRGHLVCRLLLE